MTIQEFKKQNPTYAKVNDYVLADEFYNKYYADNLTKEQFYKQIGLPLREQDQPWANNDFEALRIKQTYPEQPKQTVPQRPGEKAPEFKEYSLMDKLVGGLEADAALATSMGPGFVGYASGLVEGLGQQIGNVMTGNKWDNKAIEEKANEGMARFTYEPKTPAGQEITERVGGMMTNLMAFGPHPEMMTGDIGAATSAASPYLKAKSGQAIQGVQKISEPIVKVTKPIVEKTKKVFEEKLPTKPDDVAATIYKASKGDEKAKKIIQEIAPLDKEALDAADRLDIPLPIDYYLQDDNVAKTVGLSRSQVGSAEEMAFKHDIINTSQVADEALNQLGKVTDVASVSDDVKSALQAARSKLKEQEKILYQSFDETLPLEQPIVAENLFDLLSKTADELGGESRLTATEKNLLALSKAENLTYGALLRAKNDIGSAVGGQKTLFPDVNDFQLKKIYDAIREDQKAAVSLFGGEDQLANLKLANTLTVKRKAIENSIIQGYGRKGEGSIAGLVNRAITAGSKGDVAPLDKLLSVVPVEMHKDVVATALKDLSTSKKAVNLGEFDFANYAKTYEGLRKNAPVYSKIINILGTDKAQMLQDLYTISKKIVEAKSNVLHTGKANQAIIAGLKGNTIMQNIVGKIIGWGTSKISAGLISPDFMFKTPQDKLQAIADLMRNPDFKQMMIEASNGKASAETVNKVMATDAYKRAAVGESTEPIIVEEVKPATKQEVKAKVEEKKQEKTKPTKEEVKAKVEKKKAENQVIVTKNSDGDKVTIRPKDEHKNHIIEIEYADGMSDKVTLYESQTAGVTRRTQIIEDGVTKTRDSRGVLNEEGDWVSPNDINRGSWENDPSRRPFIGTKEQREQIIELVKEQATATRERASAISDEISNIVLGIKSTKELPSAVEAKTTAKVEPKVQEQPKPKTEQQEARDLHKEVKNNQYLETYKDLILDEGKAKTKGERNQSHNWFDVPVEDDFGQTIATKRIAGQRDITEAFTADSAAINRFMNGKATVEDLRAINHDLKTFEMSSDLRDEAAMKNANKTNESVELSDGSIYDPFSKMTYSKKEWQDLMNEAMFSKSKPNERLTEWHKDSAPETKNPDGSPKVFYHGSPTGGFEVFDRARTSDKSLMTTEGPGFYFTDDKPYAENYLKNINKTSSQGSKKLYEVYLNLQKPIKVGRNTSNIHIEKAKELFAHGDNNWHFSDWIPFELENSTINGKKWTRKDIEALPKREKSDLYVDYLFSRGSESDGRILKNIVRAYTDKDIMFNNMKKYLDADGVIWQNEKGSVAVAWDSNQIKSIHNKGTFSETNPNILFSKGYSNLEETIKNFPQNKFSKEQLLGTKTDKNGNEVAIGILKDIKADEMKYSGMQSYIDSLPEGAKITKSELLDAINQPKLEKVVKGSNKPDPKNNYYYRNFPRIKKLFDESGTENEFMMKLSNDEKAYDDLIKKHPELKEADDFAEVVTNDMYDKAEWNNPTKFEHYKTKDVGTNYREVLTTIDGKKLSGDFKSAHWDEPNVLYHTRLQDVKMGNEKALLVDEIQSDLHQKGRSEGYKEDMSLKEQGILDEIQKLQDKRKQLEDNVAKGMYDNLSSEEKSKLNLEYRDYARTINWLKNERWRYVSTGDIAKQNENKAPQAPYSKTWHEKAMKDVIQEAVDNGYDRVAWTVGKTQADRYSLAKQIDKLEYKRDSKGTYYIWAGKDDNVIFEKDFIKKEDLPNLVGKKMANKIIKDTEKDEVLRGGSDFKEASGLDLEVGGEGMKGFYDKILPDWTSKYIKKYGSKVEKTRLSNGDEVWTFKVTDAMREDIGKRGQALYSSFKTKNATTKAEAQSIAKDLLGKHYERISKDLEIYQSIDDLPQNIKDALYSIDAFHGSMKERSKIGADTFFTNKPEYAEQYAGKDTRYYPAKGKSEVYFMTGGQIYPAKIELNNFKTVTKAETQHDPKVEKAIIAKAKTDGYDGLIIKYEGTPREDYVPFNDKVVKLKFDAEVLKSGGKPRGIFDPKTGKAYIIADAMKSNEVEGVILHELLHKNINNEVKAGKSRAEAIMGSRYESVVKRLDNLYKMGDKQVKEAFQKVTDANTPAQHRIEEVMTYLLENITNESKPLLIKWKDDVIQAIKAFIAKVSLQLGMKAETVMSKLDSKDIANILRSEAIKNKSMLKNIKR